MSRGTVQSAERPQKRATSKKRAEPSNMPGKAATASRSAKKQGNKQPAVSVIPNDILSLINPVGRPTDYNPDIAAEFCALISAGISVAKVCSVDGMPGIKTVYTWISKHPEFAQLYTRAKQDSAEAHADSINDIAEKVLSGEIDAKRGQVAMNGKMWTAAKLLPRKYGDRLDITTDGDKLPPPVIYIPQELPHNAVNVSAEIIEHEPVQPAAISSPAPGR